MTWHKVWQPLAVILLLAAMAAQMVGGMLRDSATIDEQIHILSGYATLTQGHVLFDPEHPYLVKAFAALPLLLLQPAYPAAATAFARDWSDIDVNTYGPANGWGFEFLFKLGNDADALLIATRGMMIALTILFALGAWWWTRRLFGAAAALCALALIAFEPSLLGHGRLANNDIGATFAYLASLAAFWTYLRAPTWRHVVLTGLVLGVAWITKFSLLLLAPTLALLLLTWLAWHRWANHDLPTVPILTRVPWTGLRYLGGLILSGLLGLGVIWVAYGTLAIINPQANPWQIPDVGGVVGGIVTHITPPAYAKGAIYILPTTIEHDREGYLLGQCYQGSRLDYFPVLLLAKAPLGILGLLLVALWTGRRTWRTDFRPWLLTVPVIIYTVSSAFNGINIGFRHFLPAYALLIILAASSAGTVNWSAFRRGQVRPERSSGIRAGLILALVAATAVSTLVHYPSHLASFNQLTGEPRAKPFIAADSNVDWGQDLRRLQEYMTQNGIDRIAIDSFTGLGEADYRQLPYVYARPEDRSYTGYLALTRSAIVNHACSHGNDWGWVVDDMTPVAIINGSINVYHLTP